MLPKGSKDLDIYENGKQITISFIHELYDKKCLKMNITVEEDILTELVTERRNSLNKTLAKYDGIIKEKNFSKLKESVVNFGFNENDLMNMYQGLFFTNILGAYELFRKYLIATLERKPLKIKGNEPLGTIMSKLKENHIEHHLEEYLEINLRNALGHDWYWIKNNEFYYIIDKNLERTKSLSLGELMIKKRQIELFTRSFTDNAFEEILRIKKSK